MNLLVGRRPDRKLQATIAQTSLESSFDLKNVPVATASVVGARPSARDHNLRPLEREFSPLSILPRYKAYAFFRPCSCSDRIRPLTQTKLKFLGGFDVRKRNLA